MLLSSPLVDDQPPRRRGVLHARGRVPVGHGRGRAGDRLRDPSRRSGGPRRALLGAGGDRSSGSGARPPTGRCGCSAASTELADGVAVLSAEPPGRRARARRPRLRGDGGAHRPRRHRDGLPGARSGTSRDGPVRRPRARRARCSLPGMQMEVEVARRYLGVDGTRGALSDRHHPAEQADKLPPLRDLVAEYAAGQFKTERGRP